MGRDSLGSVRGPTCEQLAYRGEWWLPWVILGPTGLCWVLVAGFSRNPAIKPRNLGTWPHAHGFLPFSNLFWTKANGWWAPSGAPYPEDRAGQAVRVVDCADLLPRLWRLWAAKHVLIIHTAYQWAEQAARPSPLSLSLGEEEPRLLAKRASKRDDVDPHQGGRQTQTGLWPDFG